MEKLLLYLKFSSNKHNRSVKQTTIAILLTGLLAFAPSFLLSSQESNHLIMILDPSLVESDLFPNHSNAMLVHFTQALYEKVAPILVSTNIVQTLCTNKLSLHTIKKTDAHNFLQKLLPLIQLTNSNWDCYIHNKADLMLFIPDNYSQNRTKNRDVSSILNACGFSDINLASMNYISPQTILEKLQTKKIPKMSFIESIESTFASKEEIPTSWHIYLAGHGSASTSLSSFDTQLEATLKDLSTDTPKPHVKVVPVQQLNNSRTSKKELNLPPSLIKRLQKRIKEKNGLLPYLSEKTAERTPARETATIAGLMYEEFKQLILFFNNALNTSFLFYETCFSGGFNQESVRNILEKLSVSFITATKGVNENSTFATYSSRKKPYTDFFTALDEFFEGSVPSLSTSHPIATIIKPFVNVEATTRSYNQPFVYLPPLGVFNALMIDKKVKIITDLIAKTYTLKNKPLMLTDSTIEALMLYPHHLRIPLHCKEHVAIISPQPHHVEPKHHSIHILDEVITGDSLAAFIADLAILNKSHRKITFVVKKLTCLNKEDAGFLLDGKLPISIQNLIVSIQKSSGLNSVYTLFSHKNKIFYTTQLLSDSNQQNDYQKTYQPISTPYMHLNLLSRLSHTFFGSYKRIPEFWDIAKSLNPIEIKTPSSLAFYTAEMIGKRVLTMDSLVKYFEEQTGQSSINREKPGDMEKIVREQLGSVEQSIRADINQMQKKASSSRPQDYAIFVKQFIARYKTIIQDLKIAIVQLFSENLITEEENTLLLDKIKTLEYRLLLHTGITRPVLEKEKEKIKVPSHYE